MPKGKFVTSSKPFVKRLDAALEERPSEFDFEFVTQRDEEVRVHKMSMVRSGKEVVLQWYIPFLMEKASFITVNWPSDAPPEHRPNLPLELNKMLLHPQIGKWVCHGEERVLGLYWDAVNGRFEICDALNPIDGYLPEGGQICLMPTLVRWIC